MNAERIVIEPDEDGFHLLVHTDDTAPYDFRITDPETFYDHVKASIGPWLYERDQARHEAAAILETLPAVEAYERDNPKHPRYHSTHADIWDAREGK